ncbi:MAG: DUF6371 domain-containing protein [Porphyromonadaceae bacterium]|nr:DUF6371 domain-containing protein [Porphyromonadaceae bacterium]
MIDTTYKYQLEKYTGRATRHTCPHCHHPMIFARYIDERGNYIAENVGRCNREDRCGYHLTPSEYFKNKGIDYTPTIQAEKKSLPLTDYIPEETMIRSLKTENHFVQFLTKFFSLSDVARTIDTYRIGDAKDGRVIYWQIDDQNRIRTGKIMKYDPTTGHRVKGVSGSFDWAHRHVKNPFQLNQCLYGLHLIKNDKPIAIVESEKSAIVGSMAIPTYTWMATGGKQNFRLMETVKGRNVTLFPDLGAYDQWSEHAARYGFKISRVLEDIATPEDMEKGLDIADYILK